MPFMKPVSAGSGCMIISENRGSIVWSLILPMFRQKIKKEPVKQIGSIAGNWPAVFVMAT